MEHVIYTLMDTTSTRYDANRIRVPAYRGDVPHMHYADIVILEPYMIDI